MIETDRQTETEGDSKGESYDIFAKGQKCGYNLPVFGDALLRINPEAVPVREGHQSLVS